ncbi:MAG: pyridoxamine 5'-phosphate oxidase family protein [Burkholderiales bacterium]
MAVAHSDNRVNISYAGPKVSLFVSVSGSACVVEDAAKIKELCTSMARAWFPHGFEGPNLALLNLGVVCGVYWNSSSTKMVQLYILTKAVLSGTTPTDLGEHPKIKIA